MNSNTINHFGRFEECPSCGNTEIDSFGFELDAPDKVRLEMYCNECDYEWDEVYAFSYSELPEDERED